ncbi:MAG TPA: hypothetical protein VG847_17410, partial [Chitinophagaceae bacterium]|nr:hypothetical protein [Chitinophagaceae bacterium]
MNLIFISTGEYPDTHAAAIRHSILAKGLVENGHSVRFLVLTPQKWGKQNSLDYFGVRFESLNTYKGSNKLLKKLYNLRAVSKARKIITKAGRSHSVDAITIFTPDILPILFLTRSAHKRQLKVFHERTELPYVMEKNKRILNYYLKTLLPQFDGIFVINDKLDNYIKQFNQHTK